MASVASVSRQNYRERIQDNLDLQSNTYLGAKTVLANLEQIPEKCKAWIAEDASTRIPADQMIDQLMGVYDASMKTKTLGEQLLRQLHETSAECHKFRLTPEHHHINVLFSRNPAYPTHIENQASFFIKINEHLDSLATKTAQQLLTTLQDRSMAARASIKECIEIARPTSIGGALMTWVGLSASSFDTAYAERTQKASQENKDEILKVTLPDTQAPSAEEIANANGLHESLHAYGLSWVNPDTTIRYGVQPKKELSIDPSVGSFPEENLALSIFFPDPTIAPSNDSSEMNEIESKDPGESESSSANGLVSNLPTSALSTPEKTEEEKEEQPVSFADNPLARPNPLSWDWVEASEAFSPHSLENHEETEMAYHNAKLSDEEKKISEKLSDSDSSHNPTREPSPLSLNPSTGESYELYYSEPTPNSDGLAIGSEEKKEEDSIIKNSAPHSPSKSPKSPPRERAFLEIRATRSASAERSERPVPPARVSRDGDKIPQGGKPATRGRGKTNRK